MRRWRPALLLSAWLAACAPPAAGPDTGLRLLLLVTVDTLRADRLGAYGGELGLTPELDALARESQLFTSAYAPAPVTLPSLASLMTGRYPEQLGVLGNASRLPAGARTLAAALRARGWRTAAVVSSAVLRREAGLAAGFQHYDQELPQREAVRSLAERTAPATTRAALRALDALRPDDSAPLLLWVHYQDPHGPYTPPEALRARYLPRERERPDGARELPLQRGHAERGALPAYQALGAERRVAWYRAGYDGEVRFTDAAIGELLRGVETRGLRDRSLVVFTADHGESLGEDDYWFSHERFLTDPLVRVPLLIRAPGRAPARREAVAGLVDLFPTLLRAAGVSEPIPGPGRDLLAPAPEPGRGSAYLANVGTPHARIVGLVQGPYKVLATERGGRWRARLYRRGAPTALERELDATPLRRELWGRLRSLRRELGPFQPEQRQQLGSDARERLRALGYLTPDEGS